MRLISSAILATREFQFLEHSKHCHCYGTCLDCFCHFLAAVSVYTVSLLFTLVLPYSLLTLGNPDLGQLLANYIGYWLFGVMLVVISMVGSQLTGDGGIIM